MQPTAEDHALIKAFLEEQMDIHSSRDRSIG